MIYIGQLSYKNLQGFDQIFYSRSIPLLLLQIQKFFITPMVDNLDTPDELKSLSKLAAVETPEQLSSWLEEEYGDIEFQILDFEES